MHWQISILTRIRHRCGLFHAALLESLHVKSNTSCRCSDVTCAIVSDRSETSPVPVCGTSSSRIVIAVFWHWINVSPLHLQLECNEEYRWDLELLWEHCSHRQWSVDVLEIFWACRISCPDHHLWYMCISQDELLLDVPMLFPRTNWGCHNHHLWAMGSHRQLQIRWEEHLGWSIEAPETLYRLTICRTHRYAAYISCDHFIYHIQNSCFHTASEDIFVCSKLDHSQRFP